MNKYINNDLLPEGFKVLLPYDAEKEEILSRKIMGHRDTLKSDFLYRCS